MAEEKKITKLLAGFLALCILASGALAFAYKIDRESARPINLEDVIEVTDDSQYFYGLDPVEISDDGMLHISGWVVNREKDLTYIDRKVVLADDAGNACALKTIAGERGLTWFFDTGYNYDDGGLVSQGLLKTIPVDEDYHILFLVTEDGKRYLFDLNTVVSL